MWPDFTVNCPFLTAISLSLNPLTKANLRNQKNQMTRISSIPVYHLQERAAKNFELSAFEGYKNIAHWNQAHRDDNYLLICQHSGTTTLIVDFQEIILSGHAIYCILPGQVHYGISTENASAWVLAVDSASIKENYRTIFAEFAIRNKPVSLDADSCELFRESFLLFKRLNERSTDDQTLHSMLDVCICLFVAASRSYNNSAASLSSRPLLITRQFRSLLLINFRKMKSPSEYANALNISPSYLNEVVKDTTGSPVSYWIHQEIILEAKRLLFYTNSTVKEISHLLGYNDTTYFIRLFSKTAGLSPLQFRSHYRK
jgi:AraC family transcriptional regulator, transcriptional activator of pobA